MICSTSVSRLTLSALLLLSVNVPALPPPPRPPPPVSVSAGAVKVGDRLVVSPSGVAVRVRALQKDGSACEQATTSEHEDPSLLTHRQD